MSETDSASVVERTSDAKTAETAAPCTKQARLAYLDGWRGVAVAAVIVGHYFPLPGINADRLGVELFFVLSGRLMADILFCQKVALPTFFKRRISRVWPALFVFVFAMLAAFHDAPGELNVSLAQAAAALTFTTNYASLYIERSAVLDHIWSLCVEEHMYLVLALIAFLARRTKLDPLKAVVALAMLMAANGAALTYALGLDYYAVYWRTDVRGASILMAVAVWLWLDRTRWQAPAWLPIVAAAAGLLLSLGKVPDPIKYSAGTLLLAIAVCTLNRLPTILDQLLSNQIIQYVGIISFSLYLWQQPFFKLIGTAPLPVPALLAVAICLALVSYYAVEVPARSYINARWARQRHI